MGKITKLFCVLVLCLFGIASTNAATKTIGLVPGPWATDDATFAVYAFNSDTENAWYTIVENEGLYGTQVDDSYAKIIVVRLKPATAEGFSTENFGLNWANKWNQTADIDFIDVADKSTITITGWGQNDYTISAPVDIDAIKAALQEAITEANSLNAYANDETLAKAIIAAQAALASEETTAEQFVAAATALKIAATNAAKTVLGNAITLANTFGVDTAAAQAVLDKEDATAEELAAALTAMVDQAKPAAANILAAAQSFFNTFDSAAATALAPDFAAAANALKGTDVSAMITAAQTLLANATVAAKSAMEKVIDYFEIIDDETIKTDVANLKAAMEANNLQGIIAAANLLKTDFPTAADNFIKKAEFATAVYKDAGKTNGIDKVEAAIAAAKDAIADENATIVTVGVAVRNLVLALKNFVEANATYTVAGTKDLTGTEEAWQVVEANNMTLNTESGLYTWTAENITVNAESQPMFKVVITDIDNKQTWVPASDESGDHNWVITPEYLGGEGIYTITITFNAATQEIGVTGVKAETPDDAIYTINYSDYTEFPFYVMGFTPEFVDGVMVDGGSSDWHQYFIADGIPTQEKGIYTVKAMVKASEAINVNVNMGWGWNEGQSMGASVAIGTEWQEVTWKYEGVGGTSCNLVAQPGVQSATIEWKYLKVYFDGIAVEPEWTDIIVNGDMEGDDPSCFYVTEQGIGGPFLAPFTEGIGKDGSKAVKVDSYDDPAQDWDSQFFIRLPYQIPAGTKYKVSFDYKADKAGDFDTQAHTEPGGYIHWACIGSGSFTTEWKTYEAEGTVSADMSPEGKLFQTIAFNLAKNKVATRFIFDNVKFEIPSDVVKNLTLNPAQNPQPYTKPVFESMAIVGDFLGLATEENPNANWDLANGWQMTQDAENEAVWTLVVDEFTAEAKTYEYKAVANGSWDGYKLPNEGNADYNFDTPNLGAGKYKLTFTVDTRKHSLNLDVEKLETTTYTATFTTDAEWEKVYAYAWSGTEGQEGFKKFLGDWPGTPLEAVDGVYTVNIVSTDAPEKIVFNNGTGGEGNQTSDLEFVNGGAYEYKKPSGEEDPVKVAPQGWVSLVTNGNLADDDVSSYVSKEYPSSDVVGATIEAGAGTNGSRGIIVRAGDDTEHEGAQDWDSQFWIVLNEELPAGTKLHVEFDYKASEPATANTQSHGNPGAYQHWAAIGDVNFTTEWQSFSTDIEVNDAMAKGDNGNGNGTGLKTIAFNLAVNRNAVDYYFDNFGVWYEKPVEINSMAIVGDFLGLATEENPNADWDPANGWAMEQDAENPAIWTLTKEFTADAKTYEYKAIANGNWDDYVLPAGDNANFTFGTADYPAGDYKLVFTADTENNTIDLVVKPATVQTFTATFTTNAYWWDEVYAYAWTEDGENVTEYLGAWPGTKLKVNAEGVYTVNVEGEVAPEMICFSNGNTGEGNQTEDLAFVAEQAYQYVFTPTFDFENNNGQWAENATTFTMDDITLTGVKNVKYTSGQLRIGNRTGSFTLAAPAGKKIVKLEIKVLSANEFNLTPSTGEVVKTKELVQGEEENAKVIYSIWTWTSNDNDTEVSFDLSGVMQRNLGFINVTLEDNVPVVPDVYTVAGSKELTGTTSDWEIADSNNMTLNEETGLYEWKNTEITVTDEINPFFKVVKNAETDTEEWYPAGGESTNWIITLEALKSEKPGKFTIIITFNPETEEIAVTGELTTDLTGINAIATADSRLNGATIYNMNGQRIQNTRKGLYIVNGHKVVIK